MGVSRYKGITRVKFEGAPDLTHLEIATPKLQIPAINGDSEPEGLMVGAHRPVHWLKS